MSGRTTDLGAEQSPAEAVASFRMGRPSSAKAPGFLEDLSL